METSGRYVPAAARTCVPSATCRHAALSFPSAYKEMVTSAQRPACARAVAYLLLFRTDNGDEVICVTLYDQCVCTRRRVLSLNCMYVHSGHSCRTDDRTQLEEHCKTLKKWGEIQ